jgi:hypothetical protein
MKGTTIAGWVVAFILGSFVISIALSTCNTAAKMHNNAQETVYQQFKPSELLRKYEWFKDASAELDQKVATFDSYNRRFSEMKSAYGADSSSRTKWSREDKEQWNIWQSEYTGLVASYNTLAAQYNAEMSKFNYQFCNRGDLPKGATEPVKREYREYK